jgi:predicted nucleic acid-binding protein
LKILVDTSAWVDFLNGHPSPEGRALAALIAGEHDLCTCGIVVAEVFQGLRREKEEIDTLFRHLTFLEPASVDAYFRAAEIYRSLRQKGRTVRSTVDCLIAAIAEEHGCHVLARDRDLDLVLSSGLVRANLWPPPR